MRFFAAQKILHGDPLLGELPDDRTILQNTLKVAWPSILESFLVSLVSLIDTVMVGGLGAYAIAAVGLTTQPKFIGMAIFMSLNVAISAVVARRRGEQDRDSANRVLTQAILIVLGLSVIISIICVTFAEPIVVFAGAADDTKGPAADYFRIIMGGMVFNVLSMAINAAQRGAGNTKIAMRTNIVSNLVNIIFNYLLIGGNLGFPRLEVRGAAIATVLGTICALFMSVFSVIHKDHFLCIREYWSFHFDRKTLKAIINIGSSSLIEQIFLRIGFLTYSIVVAHLGTVAFAAHQIGMNLMNISFSFGDGLSVASVALVGKSLGEEREDLAKIYGGICQRVGVFIACIISITYFSLGKIIFSCFSNDPQIIDYGVMIMRMQAIVVFMQVSQVIFSGCLRGAGDVKFTAFVSFISVMFIRPGSGWLFCYPLGLGLFGAWLGLAFDQMVRFLMTMARFKSGKWTKIKI